MEDVVLPETSLAAIVRDEAINPAGGIMRFLQSVLPHVEEAIVVDTGSTDGTRDLLTDATRQFSHLRVGDYMFDGYAQARNYSLAQVRTRRALVLDADELIIQGDYPLLKHFMSGNKPVERVGFSCINIYFDCALWGECHNPRLFPREGSVYENKKEMWMCEHLHDRNADLLPIQILHFRTTSEAAIRKRMDWYRAPLSTEGPAQTPSFLLWKMFNPKRDEYCGSNLDIPTAP